MPENASFAPVATRSMTPLTWTLRSSTARTTKLARLTWLIRETSYRVLSKEGVHVPCGRA